MNTATKNFIGHILTNNGVQLVPNCNCDGTLAVITNEVFVGECAKLSSIARYLLRTHVHRQIMAQKNSEDAATKLRVAHLESLYEAIK